MRRDALKSLKVDSVEDYLRERSAIVRYLTTRWIRFTEKPVARRNTHRSALHPDWSLVIEAFERWTGVPNGDIRRERIQGCDIDGLVRQALGCMATYIVAESDGEILPYDEFMACIDEKLREVVTPEELIQTSNTQTPNARSISKGPSSTRATPPEAVQRPYPPFRLHSPTLPEPSLHPAAAST